MGDEEGEIKRVNIGFYRRVWEGNERNRSRKGWKNGRRKNCGIDGMEGVHRVNIICIDRRRLRKCGRKETRVKGSNVGC